MTTLVRRLKARGHDVVFISVLDTGAYAFVQHSFHLSHMSKLQGQAALEFVIGEVANVLEGGLQESASNPAGRLRRRVSARSGRLRTWLGSNAPRHSVGRSSAPITWSTLFSSTGSRRSFAQEGG
jgi:hypothetical protein